MEGCVPTAVFKPSKMPLYPVMPTDDTVEYVSQAALYCIMNDPDKRLWVGRVVWPVLHAAQERRNALGLSDVSYTPERQGE